KQVIGHSLVELVAELSEKDPQFQKIQSEARRLDRYYIPTRYPNGLPGGTPFQVFTTEDLGGALEDVNNVFKIARDFMDKIGEKIEIDVPPSPLPEDKL
ncbi:MAG TPA: HEPN domain-containing protein, partial [Thermodesulfobacteriota bacterium]|nr:HEPN domain-containing protein [Thermodesulfobacteriota bacterium]